MIYTEESKEDKWITISHQHVLVGADGTIKAGLGGKFNGKPVQHAIDHLTSQSKASKPKASAPKEKVDKPKTKMQHAAEMIKNASPDALAKDIKKQLANKLGLSPAAASTYYHNIKKKLAPKDDEKEPDKKVEKENPTEKDVEKSPKKTYKDVVDKVEGNTSKAKQAEQIYNQMLGSKSKEVKDAFVKKLGISPATASTYYHNIKKKMGDNPALEDDTTNTNFTPAKTITSDDIHDIIDNNYSAGKDAVIKKIKDKFGLNNGDAIAHFDNVHSAWVEKKAKKEVPIIAKNYLEKNAAEPKEFFKNAYMIDDKEAEHIMGMHNYVLDDMVSGSSDLSVSGLKNQIQSIYPLDDKQATDLADVIKKYTSAQINWSKVSDTFWNLHSPKDLSGHKDYKMSQNEKELKALEIYKSMPNATASEKTMALIKHLKISSSEAIDLAIKADKVVGKQKTYQDIKNKVESASGGASIKHNHTLNTTIPDQEQVKVFKSRVSLAKEIDPHVHALDPHDHLIKVNTEFYRKAPESKKALTDAVYNYTGHSYSSINETLRNKGDLREFGFVKDTVETLDKVFAHKSARIKKETIVYRGYTSKIVNNLEPGDIFEDRGYMSTTSEEHKAESWAHSGGAVMHILLPEGANAISARPYSQYTSEHEILINRGAKIRIIEKVVQKAEHYRDDDQITFYAEYIVDKK